jgi:hypothetical protein
MEYYNVVKRLTNICVTTYGTTNVMVQNTLHISQMLINKNCSLEKIGVKLHLWKILPTKKSTTL